MYVFNIGDHWITASNNLLSQLDIYWFNSSHSGNISPFTIVQLSSLLRRQTDRDDITFIHRATEDLVMVVPLLRVGGCVRVVQ